LTPLEQKQVLLALRAEVTALRDRVGALEAERVVFRQMVDNVFLASKPLDVAKVEANVEQIKKKQKLCPHCGEQPAYFFHVKSCAKNKKNKGVNGEVIRD
jgi:DNA repair exonuclease SbcCD ATPase subunit